jgi:hypothetical protein
MTRRRYASRGPGKRWSRRSRALSGSSKHCGAGGGGARQSCRQAAPDRVPSSTHTHSVGAACGLRRAESKLCEPAVGAPRIWNHHDKNQRYKWWECRWISVS